tara:strand:+ start:17990 stop:19042 length:1053 start_codon:yes stop_codon:yes gene_type:complete
MKILLLSNMYPSAQKPYAGIYVKNLYEALRKDGSIDLSLLTMRRSYTGPIGSILKYLGFFIRFLGYLPRRYDIVHLQFFFPLIYLLSIYKLFHPSTKLVVTYHGTDIEAHANNKFARAILRFIAKVVSHHVVVGKDLAEVVKSKLKVESVDIVPAGVNEEVFYNIPNCKKEYDFLFVGSFFPPKGVPELIAAIRQIDDLKPKFCFVGSGPLLADLEDLARTFDITIFQNLSQEELRKVYNQSRFLILPSKREAFGLVVTEAMFCGTPVLVTPVGGLKDQVKECDNGFFIKGVTTPAIVEGIRRVCQLEKGQEMFMAERALKSNRQFSLVNVCKYHIKTYRKLLALGERAE